ncbi:MAG: ligase-associated DNA damage response DEXH box helicase [Ignavibacteria bacterium]|nr:ligase-associated DNA damage response DEXH box helicase [Ignavibacteria bacterium]
MDEGLRKIRDWFLSKGWKPFEFQEEVWSLFRQGYSGLIHSATGTGKTYSAFLGSVIEFLNENHPKKNTSLKVLWITPMRALANDIVKSLKLPITEMEIEWKVESRTGDTTTSQRAKQIKSMPDVLVTTPESLTLLISQKDSKARFNDLRCIVIDEWHELLSSKRGVMTELALARLRRWNKKLKVWGVSATIGNLDEALHVLNGAKKNNKSKIVRGVQSKKIVIDSIIPNKIERFPWAGHIGLKLLPDVIKEIEKSRSTIVFTNTRSQTEIWFQAILNERPDWAGQIALHHGSIGKEVREFVENELREGKMKCVVSTSSLDLGVDFSPVERVLQIGSPKGVARLLQRAGRSGHQPGAVSRVTCVPTNAFELIEISAVRDAALQNNVEPRVPVEKPLDLLSQHLVTLALGDGYELDKVYGEIRNAFSYKKLSEKEFLWVIDFVTKGGTTLGAYPEFHKVVKDNGKYFVENRRIAQRHRMSIGTIVSDASMIVQFMGGSRLGSIEESFISRLKPGDVFVFSGRTLEFVKAKDMTAYVKKSPRKTGIVPRWDGGRLPLSHMLSEGIRKNITSAKHGIYESREMQAVESLLEYQNELSALPSYNEVLIEKINTREGFHVFIYTFEGKLVNEGLNALFGYRISKIKPVSFSMASSDYGLELLSDEEIPIEEAIRNGLFSPENIIEDINESLNTSELAKRQFRQIARIAGLIFQGYPGSNKSVRQIQASTGLFYDIFTKYDPENLLIHQTHKEVLESQLEQTRLVATLKRMNKSKITITSPDRPTPMCFPLLAEIFREKMTTEQFSERIRKLIEQYEKEN